MSTTQRVLIIHQSGSLYGSDRSLLDWLEQAQEDGFEPIVCTPEAGPLTDILRQKGIEVHVIPVFKVDRASLSDLKFVLGSPLNLIRSLRAIDRVLRGRAVSIVYSNTIVVFVGAAWAYLRRLPHVWHIREAAFQPAFVATAMRKVVALFSAKAICNSQFTQRWLLEACNVPTSVVWNGVPVVADEDLSERRRTLARNALNLGADECLILLPGRLSLAKGQDLLVEAVNALPDQDLRFRVLIVGDEVKGGNRFRARLVETAASGRFAERITILGFEADLSPLYLAADIVVIPSKHPESFGRVAIEAMAFGRPVIAAAQGGMLEIVEDGVSGVLFEPKSVAALTDALCRLINDPGYRSALGAGALQAQRNRFSVQSYRSGVSAQLSDVLSRRTQPT
jgi:glycosyltransferase involved in cell wall biosynthesis